jgi:hypothetical protein
MHVTALITVGLRKRRTNMAAKVKVASIVPHYNTPLLLQIVKMLVSLFPSVSFRLGTLWFHHFDRNGLFHLNVFGQLGGLW